MRSKRHRQLLWVPHPMWSPPFLINNGPTFYKGFYKGHGALHKSIMQVTEYCHRDGWRAPTCHRLSCLGAQYCMLPVLPVRLRAASVSPGVLPTAILFAVPASTSTLEIPTA